MRKQATQLGCNNPYSLQPHPHHTNQPSTLNSGCTIRKTLLFSVISCPRFHLFEDTVFSSSEQVQHKVALVQLQPASTPIAKQNEKTHFPQVCPGTSRRQLSHLGSASTAPVKTGLESGAKFVNLSFKQTLFVALNLARTSCTAKYCSLPKPFYTQ